MTERRHSGVDGYQIFAIHPSVDGFYVFEIDWELKFEVPETDFTLTVQSEKKVRSLWLNFSEGTPYEQIRLIDGTPLSDVLKKITKSVSVTPDCNNLKIGSLSFVADSA